MTHFSLKLLGSVALLRDGKPSTQITSRKAMALFIFLACTGRPHPREKLADLLWDATSTEQSLSNLRTILARLGAVKECLIISRDSIALDPQASLSVDAVDLERAVAYGGQPRTVEEAQRLSQALDLYQGEFLAGFHVPDAAGFVDWASPLRERLHTIAAQGSQWVANFHESRAAYDDALHAVHRMLRLDPLDEAAHLQMMRLLATTGQRAAALSHFEKVRRLLEDELGAPPDDALRALCEEIQSNRFLTTLPQPTAPSAPEDLATNPSPRAPQWRPQLALPRPTTAFIGRTRELSSLNQLLQNEQARLITISGPGGIGKTRLALEAAWSLVEEGENGTDGGNPRFATGVIHLSLEKTQHIDEVVAELADALGFQASDETNASLRAQVTALLHDADLLLVLDGFEHLVEESDFVADLMKQTRRLKILATSREPLNLTGEWVFEVGGLALPPVDTSQRAVAYHSDAVSLFIESGRRAWSRFAPTQQPQEELSAIAQICRLVDGAPLAIELAAGWVQTLSCREIAGELVRDLDLLSTSMRDFPPRHRSLRVVFERSWQMLTPTEQGVLCRLSVFEGSFDRNAAREIAGAALPVLAALVRKSLIQRSGSDRYNLHSLVQHYTAEALAAQSAERNETQRRHAHFFAALLQRWQPLLYAERSQKLPPEWWEEYDNLRTAFQWAVACADAELVGAMADGFARILEQRSRFSDGLALFSAAVERFAPDGQPTATLLAARLWVRRAFFSQFLGDTNEAMRLLTSAYTILHDGVAPHEEAFCLLCMAITSFNQSEHEQALTWAQLALMRYQALNDDVGVAHSHHMLGKTAMILGRHVVAGSDLSTALHIAQQSQLQRLETETLDSLGQLNWQQGDYAAAATYWRQALSTLQREPMRYLHDEARVRNSLGFAAWSQGDYTTAEEQHVQALQISQQIGNRKGEAEALSGLGRVMERLAEFSAAFEHYTGALLIARSIGDRHNEAVTLSNLGFVAYHQADYATASRHFSECLTQCRAIGFRRYEGMALVAQSLLALLQEDLTHAEALAREALTIAEATADPTVLGYAHTHLGHALLAQGRVVAAEDAYQQALTLRLEMNDPGRAQEPRCGLADCAHRTQRQDEALAHVEAILSYLKQGTLERTLIPLQIHFTCYQVLSAAGDLRADQALASAVDLLRRRANGIHDPQQRRRYLEEVPLHRAILAVDESTDT